MSEFAGYLELAEAVRKFVAGHYDHEEESSSVHGNFQVDGQTGSYTHYHNFEPAFGHKEYLLLRINTVLLENIESDLVAVDFVNFANNHFSHRACLSHLTFYPEHGTIGSSSQTVLTHYNHDLFHDIFSNHIMNNHWYLELATESPGLGCGFDVAVDYENGSSSGN